MDNYEAFLQMDRDCLESIPDQVYLTGIPYPDPES